MAAHVHCVNLPWMIDFHATPDGKTLNHQLKAALAPNSLLHREALSIISPTPKARLTGWMCPIPYNASIDLMTQLLENGMNVAVFRITEYEKDEQISEVLDKLRTVKDRFSIKSGRVYPLAIAFDLKGNNIRTGVLKDKDKSLALAKGDITHLTSNQTYEEVVDKNLIYLDFPELTKTVKTGDKIILGSESVTLSALEAAEDILRCIIERAGSIISRDTVDIRGSPLSLPEISVQDEKALQLAIAEHIDVLFLSGITTAKSVTKYKEKLTEKGRYILLIAKIENIFAVQNINGIIKEVDGVLIDGNRLMIEVGPEKLYLIQKSITAKCIKANKCVSCTIDFQQLKKADVMDITYAIGDSVDSLYLCATPTLDNCFIPNLEALRKICIEAEAAAYSKQLLNDTMESIPFPDDPHRMIAIGVIQIALKMNIAAIIILTVSGRSAKIVSNFRPRCPIIAITRNETVAQQLHMYRGVDSVFYVKGVEEDWDIDTERRLQLGMTYAKYAGYVKGADAVITVKGFRPGSGFTNAIKVVYASSYDVEYKSTRKKSMESVSYAMKVAI